jgi:hypothetical protein
MKRMMFSGLDSNRSKEEAVTTRRWLMQ